MIENTAARNDQTVKRIVLRNNQETFANVIAAGTSCSKFEAEVISSKALEIFNLGPCGDDSTFLPGQMSWRAIDATEPPGKPLHDCKYQTIRLYTREIEQQQQKLLPRRGTIHDMGPTLTHKRIICIKCLREGKTIEMTAQETNHSPEAVTKYINDFKRVYTCLSSGWEIEKISYATGLSKSLTKEYINLINEERSKK